MPWETTGDASSATSFVTVNDGTDWAEGDVGEFDDGDTFWVRQPVAEELTSVRSYYGSTGAFHASGSRILKNPKYKHREITNAISSVINFELPFPRIYKVASDTITPDQSGTIWYDLDADALGLVSVEQLGDNIPVQRRRYGEFHKWTRVRFERNLPTSLCASGVGLAFPDGFLDNDNTVYVTFAEKITDDTLAGEYLDFDAGDAVVEAIVLGSVALLQSALELRKPRKGAQETDNLRSGSYFGQLYKKALWTAEKEIRARYPLMAL
jgi:hypothetical protein